MAGVRVAVAALLLSAVVVAADNESHFTVNMPAAIQKEYSHNEALFGIPQYGGKISGELLYSTPTADDYGCNAYADAASTAWPEDAVLLVDRGVCPFVKKVRMAEQAGAVGVVVSDNVPMCGTTGCPACGDQCAFAANPNGCACFLPVMSGQADDITVPSYIISKGDGQTLKDCLAGTHAGCAVGQTVLVSMEWSLPQPDDTVEWEMWTSSVDGVGSTFKAEFEPVVKQLGASSDFTPHYMFLNGTRFGCTSANNCGNQCTNGGRYCEADPDARINEGVSGAQVVQENVRQLCVWSTVAKAAPKSNGAAWWVYVNEFNALCATIFTEACSHEAMGTAGVDVAAVTKCVADSGGYDTGSGVNKLMEAELEKRSERGVLRLPTFSVNNVPLRGGTATSAVLGDICVGFLDGTEPPVCACVGAGKLDECVADVAAGKVPGVAATGGWFTLPWWGLLLLSLGCVIVSTLAGVAYYRHSQAQMREQVRHILSEYMPLEDVPRA